MVKCKALTGSAVKGLSLTLTTFVSERGGVQMIFRYCRDISLTNKQLLVVTCRVAVDGDSVSNVS